MNMKRCFILLFLLLFLNSCSYRYYQIVNNTDYDVYFYFGENSKDDEPIYLTQGGRPYELRVTVNFSGSNAEPFDITLSKYSDFRQHWRIKSTEWESRSGNIYFYEVPDLEKVTPSIFVRYYDSANNDLFFAESVKINTPYTVGHALGPWPIKSEGYRFLNFAKDISLRDFYYDYDIEVREQDIVIYAVWTKRDIVPFHFYPNFGGASSYLEQRVAVGKECFLRENEFSREGYRFLGWNEEKDATTPTYVDKDYVLVGKAPLSLYAIWKAE